MFFYTGIEREELARSLFLHPETKERFKKLGKNNSNIYSGQHILSPKNGEKILIDKNDLPLFPAQKIVKLSNNDFVEIGRAHV